MNNGVLLLRISYWAAAVADVLIAILELIPERMGEIEYRYPMGLAAATAFSWAFILIWADRKPVERKGVLLPTILVIALLQIAPIYAVYANIFTIGKIIPTMLLAAGLLILLSVSYYKARSMVN
jgi:hypothetical protein